MAGNNLLERLKLFDRTRSKYRAVWETREGRAVLEDILKRCRYGQPSRAYSQKTGGFDPLALAVAEGHREIAAHIVKYVGLTDVEMQLRLARAHNSGEQYDND